MGIKKKISLNNRMMTGVANTPGSRYFGGDGESRIDKNQQDRSFMTSSEIDQSIYSSYS